MFKYDKATKNKYVGKKIKTHKYNERHLYVHEYTLTFLITYDSCEKKVYSWKYKWLQLNSFVCMKST